MSIQKYVDKFKRYIVLFVLILLMVVLALASVEVAVLAVRQILIPPVFLLDAPKLLEIFSFVMMMLIGLELVESVEIYLGHAHAKYLAEPILLIAITAIARKIIVLDLKSTDSLAVFGLAAILLALVIGYYLIRKTRSIPEMDDDG